MLERIAEALAAAREVEMIDHHTLADEARASVVEWRYPAHGTEPHRPEPWWSQREGRFPQWVTEPDPDTEVRVGFDAEGRPLLHEINFRLADTLHLEAIWRHGDGWSQMHMGNQVRHYVFEDGRMVLMAGTWHGDAIVEHWETDERGHVVNLGDTFIDLHAFYAQQGPEGLEVLATTYVSIPREGLDELAAIERGLEEAAEMFPDAPVYDARKHAPAGELRPTHELVETLVTAIEAAVVKLYDGGAVKAPFVLELRLSEEWPPFLRIGGDAFRQKMTGRSPEDGAALLDLYKAQPPDGDEFTLEGWLGDDAMRACRELNQNRYEEGAIEAQERIGRELTRRLNERDWPGAADPFLALVHITRPYENTSASDLAAEVVGQERVQAFHRSLKSRRKGKQKKPAADARTDRAALERVLREAGLEAHARRLAAEVAQVGCKLVAGEAGSRLGGPPLLPPGEDWPRDADGRPLTFLAGLDLAELAMSELPPEGWLLFYADLANDDAEGFVDHATNTPGAKARALFTDAPVEASPPDDLEDVLEPRSVRAERTLTLPDDFEVGERLGLDPSEESALEAVAGWLRYGDRGYDPEAPDHWVLGAVSNVQGAPGEPESLLLLHIATDWDLDFEFLDGGAIQFRIPRDALRDRDWSQVVAEAESH